MCNIPRALPVFCLSLLVGSIPARAQTKPLAPLEGFQISNRSGQDKYSRPFVRIDTGNSASWTYNLQP